MDRSAPGEAWRLIVLVVAAGLAAGVATQLGQSLLPDRWSQVANAISPWLLVAFCLVRVCPIAAGPRSPGSRPWSSPSLGTTR